ncbi:MAG: cyclic nucleotide-binding domain-containing protein [Actinomycetota bacterium]|nr:cyclic nucleotide-binding domain-containing protein [Actinomycetota bacterium]
MDKRVPHSLVQTLGSLPDFAGLDEEDLLTIAGESMNLGWNSGSIIFKRGDQAEALYLVVSGECSIHDGDHPSAGEVAHPKAGDSFGEMSLLLNATHSRTATAVTDCELLVLPKESFTKLLDSNPKLAAHFAGVAEGRHAPALKNASSA